MIYSLTIFDKSFYNNHFFKWILCFVFIGFSYAQNAQNQSLNGKWSFKIDPYSKGETEGWFHKNLDTKNWDTMSVPGNWDLINEYSEYAGNAWYSKTFKVNSKEDLQRIRLVFQSVYNDSKIWVNGQFVGENHLGFLPFHFNISKHLVYGKQNRVTVLVNNVFKRGAIWNWGGIRRPVWLEITPVTRLEFQHIEAVPNLKKGTANIDLKIISSNTSSVAENVDINIVIKRNNKIVAKKQLKTKLPAHTNRHEVNWSTKLSKSKVDLWHYDFPNLYECIITLINKKGKQHRITDRFGIRKLEIDGLKLLLNGESIRPVGFNVVPEDRFTGNTLPFHRIKEDVDLMKSLGVNMARLSHLSLPKQYLDYLDEKGILVFEEVGLWGKDAWVDPDHPMPKEWLQRIVEKKYNHPSIVGWSVGNEIGKVSANPKVKAYVKGAVEMAKKLNPNRLAFYVSHTAKKFKDDPITYGDIAMINMYGGWGKGADKVWENHKMPIFVSEFGSRLNSENPNLGTIPIQKMMNSMRNKPYTLGVSLWTFNDYRSTYHGTSGWKTPESQNRAWGVVTSFRDKKRGFYNIQKEYAPITKLLISDIDTKKGKAIITIKPRKKLDIPANILRGFKIRWSVLDTNFKISETNTTVIKTINPGDVSFKIPINWTKNKIPNAIKVEFLDPQNYTVLEEIDYLKVPKQPIIKFVNTAHNSVRILFDKFKGAEEHLVKYQQGDSVYFSKKTINNFIDIEDTKVKQGAVWKYQLIAINSKGESEPSKTIELAKDEDEMPPIIWNFKHTNNGVFIAYAVSPYDYLYEVEYGTTSGNYNKQIQTKVKGVLNIPNIKIDETIYFRMRVRKQWGFASEWSQEYKIN